MADSVECEVCGKTLDARGLAGHMRTHETNEIASTVAESSALKESPDEGRTIGRADVAGESVTVRAAHEVVVQDEELKREVVDALKEMVSDGGFKPHSSKGRFD
jgi:hypothetical protein